MFPASHTVVEQMLLQKPSSQAATPLCPRCGAVCGRSDPSLSGCWFLGFKVLTPALQCQRVGQRREAKQEKKKLREYFKEMGGCKRP